MRRGVLAPLLAMLILLAAAAAAQANTITVNDTGDPTGAGDCLNGGQCSLRQAVGAASSDDTIQLSGTTESPVVYALSQGATLAVAKNLTIQGSGPRASIIDGSANGGYRPLTVSGGTVTISGVAVSNGRDDNDEQFQSCSPCETLNANGGGALFNNGATVSLNNVAFTGDSAPVGGAVSNGYSGTLNMTDVSFTGDDAAFGGGLFVRGGTVNGTGVTFENNGTGSYGGGAAFLYSGAVNLTNATIVGNGWASSFGGGIDNASATLTLINATLSGNLRGAIETDYGTTKVGNTIIGAGFSDGSDYACVGPGKQNGAGYTSSNAITTDLGYNIDEDGHCNLTDASDHSNVDPVLAPIADNGGLTRTQALLAGSPALHDPSTSSNCPAVDQRGTARPTGSCDIGAFEAVINGQPTIPTTNGAANITDTSAELVGTINLHGEAGGFHFVYGTSAGDLSSRSDEVGAGVVSSDTPEAETLSYLTPDTTYYYAIVADNASGSVRSENVRSFTTQPGPPVISNVSVDSITDKTATVHFTIDPQGADTTYFVEYGPDTNYAHSTQTVDAGSAPGPVDKSVTLTGLDPGSTVHFDVVASNDAQQNVDNGDQSFQTLQAITGIAGQPVTITDSGNTGACPAAAATTVDWGDGSSDTGAQIQCSDNGEDGQKFQLADSHVYAVAGDYPITISYPDPNGETHEFAHISARPSAPPPTNPSPPAANPSPPTVGAATTRTVTVTSAGFEGTVTPNGLPTQAYFQYGLDPKYSGGGAIVYDHSTPAQSVGADFSSHTFGPIAISGLLPNALYHLRLVATNADGTTFGPDVAFTTAAAPAPAAPVVGKTFDITPVSGFVLIRINGKFVPLTGADQIPSGALIDARHGSLELITSTGQKRKTQHGVFGGAIFKLTQERSGAGKGLVTLALVEGAFKGAPSYALCKAHAAADPTATTASSKTLQLLKASAHGKFRTKGRYSAATVRGTIWTIADRCDGTLTHVITDSVAVTDLVRHRTIILHAGQSYLAKAGKHK